MNDLQEASTSGRSPEKVTRSWTTFWESWLIPHGTDSGETSRRVEDVTQRYDGYHPAAWEEEAELQYASDLALARSDTDEFEDLAASGFLTLPCADLAGRRLVLFVPDKLPTHISSADFERVYQYIIATLDSVVESDYMVVYVHTGASEWKARPSILWLRSQYERLPIKYKMHLRSFLVLHTDLALRAAMTCTCPFFSHGFWGKVAFITRVEFLWDHVSKCALERKLPGFVLTHDDLLEDQPLHDYGYVKEAELPLPGPSGEPI